MNKLSLQKRAQIIGMLVEGNSLRAISRMADVSINTVTKLLVDIGKAVTTFLRSAALTKRKIQTETLPKNPYYIIQQGGKKYFLSQASLHKDSEMVESK